MSAAEDVITFERPEGISDARWDRHKLEMHIIYTGHAPWCSDHETEADYCRREIRSRAADVVIHNSGPDGTTGVCLFWNDEVQPEALTLGQAAAAAQILEEAVEWGRRGNLTKEPSK